MGLGYRNILSIALVDKGAAFVQVSRDVRGVRRQHLCVIDNLANTSDDELRRRVGDHSGQMVITLWPGRCLVRPVTFGRDDFYDGLQELERSAGELFPLPADDVMLGYMRRIHPQHTSNVAPPDAGGYLIAAQRSRAKPVIERLQRVLGIDAATILAPTMSMLGFGFQDRENATVHEAGSMGTVCHTLRFGQVVELGTDASVPHADGNMPANLAGANDRAFALAEGGALAIEVASKDIAPLQGQLPGQALRWVPPVVLAGAAAALLLIAPVMLEARHERAIESIQTQRTEIAQDVAKVQQARLDIDTYTTLIGQAHALGVGQATNVLDDLLAVHHAVPDAAFLERIDIHGSVITMRGAAERAGDVLVHLEASLAFESARDVSPPTSLGPSIDMEEFEIAAQRISQTAQFKTPVSRDSEVQR